MRPPPPKQMVAYPNESTPQTAQSALTRASFDVSCDSFHSITGQCNAVPVSLGGSPGPLRRRGPCRVGGTRADARRSHRPAANGGPAPGATPAGEGASGSCATVRGPRRGSGARLNPLPPSPRDPVALGRGDDAARALHAPPGAVAVVRDATLPALWLSRPEVRGPQRKRKVLLLANLGPVVQGHAPDAELAFGHPPPPPPRDVLGGGGGRGLAWAPLLLASPYGPRRRQTMKYLN